MVPQAPRPVDTVIIPGGFGIRAVIDDPAAVAAVAALIDRSTRLVTVCSGALLAAARVRSTAAG